MNLLHSSIAFAAIVHLQHSLIFKPTKRTVIETSRRITRMGTRFDGIAHRFARYRTYRETLNELDQLSDRELTDLGLERARFREIARNAAYGG